VSGAGGAPAAVLAVDGGNSKTDVLLVADDGRILGQAHGGTISHQAVPLEVGLARLRELVARAAGDGRDAAARRWSAGTGPVARIGSFALAGADFPRDIRLLERVLGGTGLVDAVHVHNDCFAALRAGAAEGWGVVLICGEGVNAAGVTPDRRVARYAAIGELSGDWGGGHSLGQAALASAIRARDGRGPRTALETALARHFGVARPETVMLAMYEGRIPERRLSELAPTVLEIADAGDAEARAIVDRLVRELAAMVGGLVRRLRLVRRPVPVVLAGGVFSTTSARFHADLAAAIGRVAPRARPVRLDVPPVVGAALLGLDTRSTGGPVSAEVIVRLRRQALEAPTPSRRPHTQCTPSTDVA